MKTASLLLACCLAMVPALAQSSDPFPLWNGATPGARGVTTNDIPTLTPYLPAPDRRTGSAVVICPGGGYGGLAAHEGHDYAEFLRQQGIAAFVLRYRLGSAGYRHPIMLGDAARAVRRVRHEAERYAIDPRRIGIMGSSAGGHLASTLLTHFDAGNPEAPDPVDRRSSRPDLGILCYPVITLGEFTHQGSKKNLLGDSPDPGLVELLSNEKQVTRETPPTFLWHTWEDQAVAVENSLQFAAALRRAGVPFDLHVYQQGKHGIGLQSRPPEFNGVHPWAKDLLFWLQAQGFLGR